MLMAEHASPDSRRPLVLTAIGTIYSPYQAPEGTPIQSVFGGDVEGTVVLRQEYEDALADIEGFERLWLLCWLDRTGPFTPLVVPYRDTVQHGLFATRAPSRPNPVGLSVVRLIERRGAVLRVAGIDVLDGTPLIDIKPYVAHFDAYPGSRAGWFDTSRVDLTVANGRFHGQ
jgi:tRNA-Thr(GGU) m(6)t(6)A37 methyltransferase TsaA